MRKLSFIGQCALLAGLLSSYPALAEDLCAKGLSQSPINIDYVLQEDLPSLNFRYQPIGFHAKNHLPVQIFAQPDSEIMLEVDTVRFPLTNIHIHHPSEHRLNGNQFPLEIHLVHTSLEGNLVVVAQLVVIGQHNPSLQILLDNFAKSVLKPKDQGIQFELNPKDLVAPFRGFYRYAGSETYAPCTENVTWYILKDRIEVGANQVETFHRLVGSNSREPQKMNGRNIYTPL